MKKIALIVIILTLFAGYVLASTRWLMFGVPKPDSSSPSVYEAFNVTDLGGEVFRVTDGGGEDFNVRQ